MDSHTYKYLDKINSPYDLRKLPKTALSDVSDEVREFVVDTITKTGGHFGAGLGVVELTVALHYVFNTPKDKIVLDTGHQGYPHKVLTGRKDLLHTIRTQGGLSGFLKRAESEYDSFGAGHASTSISAALGMAAARDINKDNYKVAAVIGDGAMTGGLAFEALNNCGVQQRDILVIMNDNNFSIAPNVSAVSNYFNDVYTSQTVNRLRDNIWNFAGKLDNIGDRIRRAASKLEDGVKAIVTPGVLFEAFGFNYIGPINGHNIQKLVKILESVKELSGPVFLHVITKKGYGYKHATVEKKYLHAIGKIDKITGKSLDKKPNVPKPPKYQDVFGEAVVDIFNQTKNTVAITAAMPGGTGLNIPQETHPDRVHDVGIAEGHAVTFAAGLATEGVVPIVAIYSTFLQRAYDHIIHDIAIQKLHVVFALDRAGLVGADGPTHHGVMDLSYLRNIPTMVLMAPKDEQELRDMLWSAVHIYKGRPVAIRFPRGEGIGVPIQPMKEIKLGSWEVLEEGSDVAILATGKMVDNAAKAVDKLNTLGISAELVNARFIKPLDEEMLKSICNRFDRIITVEDGQISGGFGSAVSEFITSNGFSTKLTMHGIEDGFVEHGTQEQLHHDLKLDSDGIAEFVKNILVKEQIS
ncbi:1-deoxy-D-xylulose-5-phosphate synthase [Candidatus Kapabacteria bacterium]|nr:1-deoxy-D-xylulose-5-phosphate synthase [Candidatus Kapabacteria bacterium]